MDQLIVPIVLIILVVLIKSWIESRVAACYLGKYERYFAGRLDVSPERFYVTYYSGSDITLEETVEAFYFIESCFDIKKKYMRRLVPADDLAEISALDESSWENKLDILIEKLALTVSVCHRRELKSLGEGKIAELFDAFNAIQTVDDLIRIIHRLDASFGIRLTIPDFKRV